MTTVLVVDDEKELRETTREVLESGGFDVLGAANGLEGLAVVSESVPDIILCDIIMPELDGYGLVEALQDDPSTATIPVIFLTALAEAHSIRQGMELGVDDYLIKPVMPDDLYSAINVRLRKHERIAEKHENVLKELRQNIVYALPHEMRTPLHLILGFANMLEMNHKMAEPAEILQSASAIFQAGQRLERLIENYLVCAQLEVIAADPDEQAMLQSNFTPQADEVIALTASNLAGAQARTDDLNLSLEAAALAISDESLNKLITELMDNALKFSEAGTPIMVRGTREGARYLLSVEDRGRGMDAEQIQKIGAYMQFDRTFYEQQGLGLGLAIVLRLTELHGGEMRVESKKDHGTLIYCSLPLKKV